MEVKATLTPGQAGTKHLVKQYGDQLVCVRYRYDKANKRRLKTVELIIDDKPWISSKFAITDPPPSKEVLLRIGYRETDLRHKIKCSGGKWVADQTAWRLSHESATALGLEKRIIKFLDTETPDI
ncbi:MAG: hypothetical protein AB1810_10800 [Pseudomonadota bacterium]